MATTMVLTVANYLIEAIPIVQLIKTSRSLASGLDVPTQNGLKLPLPQIAHAIEQSLDRLTAPVRTVHQMMAIVMGQKIPKQVKKRKPVTVRTGGKEKILLSSRFHNCITPIYHSYRSGYKILQDGPGRDPTGTSHSGN